MNEKILVIEDEKTMLRMVSDYLSAVGFTVSEAEDGITGMKLFHRDKPDLIVLDLMLPGIDGYEVARKIRALSRTPIIMLTARAEESDRLMGLEIGADDYVVKPFSIRELAARIRAVLRRSIPEAEPEERASQIACGDVAMDLRKRTIFRKDQRIHLTSIQFDLCARLMRSPGRVFTRLELLDTVSSGELGESYERTIDVHIKNIRKALEDNPGKPRYLLTVRGVGYKFAEADEIST